MSNAVLNFLKSALPGQALTINPEEDSDDDGIQIILAKEEDCEELAIAKYPMLLAPKVVDTKENSYLAVSKTIPRIRKMNPGDSVPRNYLPIAGWNGKKIVLATPMSASSEIVRDTLIAGLPLLTDIRGAKSSYTDMCQYIKFGFDNERTRLQTDIKRNQESYDRIIRDAEIYLKKIVEHEQLLKNLEELEKKAIENHAKEQWEMMLELIPTSLQELYIEDKTIIGITQPISLLGVYLGSYKISLPIVSEGSRAPVSIMHVDKTLDRGTNCHPHIKSGGQVCWGNIGGKIQQLATKKDYHGLMECSLKIIRHYNAADPYIPLHEWGMVIATEEETNGDRSCMNNGPRSSHIQVKKCLSCNKTSCKWKRKDSVEIFQACFSFAVQRECIECEYKTCPYYENRYSNCHFVTSKQGAAYCMLKCDDSECAYIKESKKYCVAQNKKTGPCQAADKCRVPCTE